jgi:hypothetical protein
MVETYGERYRAIILLFVLGGAANLCERAKNAITSYAVSLDRWIV